NVKASLDSAFTCNTVNPCSKDQTISTGNQTVPLNQVSSFFTQTADLSTTKSDSPDPVGVGTDLTYTIGVTNNSTTTVSNGIVITDTLDTNVTYVSSSIPCSGTTTRTCNVGALAALASTSFTITVNVNP